MQTLDRRAEEAAPGGAERRPLLPPPPPEDETASRTALTRVRRFHREDPLAADELAAPGDEWLPALLFPFRDVRIVRSDYPLVLLPAHGDDPDQPLCRPIGDWLTDAVNAFAPDPETARTLKDNLRRLERLIRDALGEEPTPVPAGPVFAEAARLLQEELALPPASAAELRGDLTRLIEALPDGARLLALTEAATLHLFLHTAGAAFQARQVRLREQVSDLSARLRDLLRIEKTRHSEAADPNALRTALGEAGADQVDPSRLAGVLRSAQRGMPRDPGRRQRIARTLEVLDSFLENDKPPQPLVVCAETLPDAWRTSDACWRAVPAECVCRSAMEEFDRLAAAFRTLFAALRVARLEADQAYEPERHDRLLEAFDWRSFSRDELQALPPVVALESVDHLAGEGMADLSRILLSARPVTVLVTVPPGSNPGVGPGDDPLAGYRFELGYLGIGHREAFVQQSSAARPEHLVRGFQTALRTTCAALHVVTSGLTADGHRPRLGAWLHAGAALEGRAHPFFRYNPEAGATWARRFDLTGNPDPEADWPAYDLLCRDDEGRDQQRRMPFTFADFALLEGRFLQHFRVVPDVIGADESELVHLAELLELPAEVAADRVPFIWATDGDGVLRRLVVSRTLTAACADRLDYWRTLQELAGVRNEYVREAVARERERLEAEFARQREQAEAEHAAELERVRNEAAGEALQRLAQALLETDLSALPAAGVRETRPGMPGPAAAEPAAPAPAEAPSQPPAEAPVEEEEEPLVQEPWITSALCTSCNECINLNPQMFKYNANNQAYIADPRAGTYAQLVQAAEKCPARCIHPGLPLNPDEPNLDELIQRAKPFN